TAGKQYCGATSVWTHVSSLICSQFFLPKSKPIPTGTNVYSCPVICTTRQKVMNSCFKHSQNTSCDNFEVERLGNLEDEMLHRPRRARPDRKCRKMPAPCRRRPTP